MKVTPRQPTQPRREPWPFLYSVVPGRGIVKNVPKTSKPRVVVTELK